MIKTYNKWFICFALNVAPQAATLYPLAHASPRPLLTSENLEPAWYGLPQCPAPKPANSSEPCLPSPQDSAWRCSVIHLPLASASLQSSGPCSSAVSPSISSLSLSTGSFLQLPSSVPKASDFREFRIHTHLPPLISTA